MMAQPLLRMVVGLTAVLPHGGCKMSAQGRNVDGVRDFQAGQYHGAIQQFQRSLTLDPNNADAYYNLAATYYALGKQNNDPALLQQAEGLYHQCLDLNPDHVSCYRGLASLLVDSGRQESAFTLVKRWAERSYYSAEPRIELARLYEEFNDNESATQHLTDALQIDAANVRAWTAMGQLREKRGELAQALANYQQAQGLNPHQPALTARIAALQQNLSARNLPAAPAAQMVNAPSPFPQR
jgi:Tfp pilus assembly protein PilF